MAEELADQVQDNSGVVGDSIPPGAAAEPTPDKEPAAPSPEQKPAKVSLRDQLKNAAKEIQAKEDATGRLHGEGGKFAAKDKKEAPATEAAPAVPKVEAKGFQPPPGWSTESKTYFNSLPPDHPLRKDVEKRESEVSSGFKQKTDDLKRYQDIEQVLAPVRQSYQQHGVQSDAEAIKRLFMWEGMIRSNPAQAIQQLARQYGVNLQTQAPASEAQDIPPALKSVVDQFGSISQKVSSFESELQRRDRESAAENLTKFAEGKPHFEKVKADMGQLMMAAYNSGRPMSLDQAYQTATWANDDIRKELVQEQLTKAEAERSAATAQRAQSARAAAVSPAPRAPTTGQKTVTKANGIRGSILAAVSELQENSRA